MDHKYFLEKTESFAKKIVNLAAEEGLTVHELCQAAETAKAIAERSTVDKESINKVDYPSQFISATIDGEGLFEISKKVGTHCFNYY